MLSFLATGAGDAIDPAHVRAAMLLRANVLARGCSGVRPEIVQRLVQFLNAGATPVVRELGSIGASGDLVPLSVIARAITDRDMRVRLEAVMACAYLESPDAIKIANLVTSQEMDGPIRTAHEQTIKYLKSKGYEDIAGLGPLYRMPAGELAALQKKNQVTD